MARGGVVLARAGEHRGHGHAGREPRHRHRAHRREVAATHLLLLGRRQVQLGGLELLFWVKYFLDLSNIFRCTIIDKQMNKENKHFEPVLVCCGFFLTVR